MSLAIDKGVPDGKVHVAHMGPTWVLSAPDGPHVGPMNLAIRGSDKFLSNKIYFEEYWYFEWQGFTIK